MSTSTTVEMNSYLLNTWVNCFSHSYPADTELTLEVTASKRGPVDVSITYSRAGTSGYQILVTAPGAARIPLVASAVTVEVRNKSAYAQTAALGLSKGLMSGVGCLYYTNYKTNLDSEPFEIERIPFVDTLHVGISDLDRRADVLIKGYMGVVADENGIGEVLVGTWRGDNLPALGIPIGQYHRATIEVSGEPLDVTLSSSLAL